MKKLISLLLVCLLTLSLTVPAFASVILIPDYINGQPKIVDNGNILNVSQEAELETRARGLANKYQIDVVILTEKALYGDSITEYADDYFDFAGYGLGEDFSGVLLMISVKDREWAISTCGKGIDAMTDRGQKMLMNEVQDYLSADDYYEGFSVYLDLLDEYFEAYENGEPIGSKRTIGELLFDVVIALVIGAAAGFITISVLKSKMKTVKPQRSAQTYLKHGSICLKTKEDIFLYSQTTKTIRPSSVAGSSSTHRSSSGRRHGGSRGRF